ncbi:MAG: hypothetical protein ACOYU3_01565 [Bacillota bacterium]
MEKTSRETCLHPAGKDRPAVMVQKDHPEIEFRGCMDTLDAAFLLTAVLAQKENDEAVAGALWEMQAFARSITRAHATMTPMEMTELMHLTPERIHVLSHNPPGGWLHMGKDTTELMAYVNLLRTQVRTAERAAVRAFRGRDDIIGALNILSSAVHVLLCRMQAEQKGIQV